MARTTDAQRYIQEYIEAGHCDWKARWYVINTNPRCEDLVYQVLTKESLEVFLPKIPKRSSKRAKSASKRALEPLFPGYIFVKLDLIAYGWVKIKYLQGVRKLLCFGGSPVPVSEEIIVSIEQKIKTGGYPKKSLSLKVGDKVRFTKGPFEGLGGIFTGEVSGKERVKILLKTIWSWPVKVEANSSELRKAN